MDKKEEEKKTPKPRAEKYNNKLAVNGTFEQVIKAAFVKPVKKQE